MVSCDSAPLPTPTSTKQPPETATAGQKSGNLLSPSELAWISGNLNMLHASAGTKAPPVPAEPHLKAAWIIQKGLPLPAFTPSSGKGSRSAGDDDDGIGHTVLAQKQVTKERERLPAVKVKVEKRPSAVQPMATGLLQQLVSAESGGDGAGG